MDKLKHKSEFYYLQIDFHYNKKHKNQHSNQHTYKVLLGIK